MRVTILFGEGGLETCAQCHQQQIHVEHTMGQEIHLNPYPIPIVRSQLTRNLGALCLEIRDEITTAFDDVLDLRGNGEHIIVIPVCYSRRTEIPRMEECASAQQRAKGSLQSDEQSVCGPSVM